VIRFTMKRAPRSNALTNYLVISRVVVHEWVLSAYGVCEWEVKNEDHPQWMIRTDSLRHPASSGRNRFRGPHHRVPRGREGELTVRFEDRQNKIITPN
jgi:hypothetical protein